VETANKTGVASGRYFDPDTRTMKEMRYMIEHGRTVIFEKKYGADIKRFSTTEQVDEFIEGKLGRKLQVKVHKGNVVTRRGSIFPFKSYDIDEKFDKILGR